MPSQPMVPEEKPPCLKLSFFGLIIQTVMLTIVTQTALLEPLSNGRMLDIPDLSFMTKRVSRSQLFCGLFGLRIIRSRIKVTHLKKRLTQTVSRATR